MRDLLSPSSIQSKTWTFVSAADQHHFDEAVAGLADLTWADQERSAQPLQGEFAQTLGMHGRTLFDKYFEWQIRHVRSTIRRRHRFAGDYGQLVLACVLAMSTTKHPIIMLTDTPAGARIVSYLPMNGATFSGTLCLDLRAENDGLMTVDARAMILGQLFDWFRGRRELYRVWQDIRTYLTAMGAQSTLESSF